MTEHWPHAVEVAFLELVEFRLADCVIDGNAVPEDGLNVGKGTRVEVPAPEPVPPVGPMVGAFGREYLVDEAALLESGTFGGVFVAESEGCFED